MNNSDHLQFLDPSGSSAKETRLESTPDGCPRIRVPGSLISLNGEIALGYLDLGYRPIPLIRDKNGSWTPAVKWAPFEDHTPARRQRILPMDISVTCVPARVLKQTDQKELPW
ncbi:MAG TPA: hypothetical protein VGA82_01565 [Dehalococcoidales bacterium]